jgi:hypothetical protein
MTCIRLTPTNMTTLEASGGPKAPDERKVESSISGSKVVFLTRGLMMERAERGTWAHSGEGKTMLCLNEMKISSDAPIRSQKLMSK